MLSLPARKARPTGHIEAINRWCVFITQRSDNLERQMQTATKKLLCSLGTNKSPRWKAAWRLFWAKLPHLTIHDVARKGQCYQRTRSTWRCIISANTDQGARFCYSCFFLPRMVVTFPPFFSKHTGLELGCLLFGFFFFKDWACRHSLKSS